MSWTVQHIYSCPEEEDRWSWCLTPFSTSPSICDLSILITCFSLHDTYALIKRKAEICTCKDRVKEGAEFPLPIHGWLKYIVCCPAILFFDFFKQTIAMDVANDGSDINEWFDIKKHYLNIWLSINHNSAFPIHLFLKDNCWPIMYIILSTGTSGRVVSSCSTSFSHRGTLVTNPVISHEWRK